MMKKYIIFISIIVLFTLGLVSFSLYLFSKIEKEIPTTVPLIEEEGKIREEKPKLTPSRPEDYGIIVIDDSNRSKTQEGWDNLLRNIIKET